jgi:hypothetical protein
VRLSALIAYGVVLKPTWIWNGGEGNCVLESCNSRSLPLPHVCIHFLGFGSVEIIRRIATFSFRHLCNATVPYEILNAIMDEMELVSVMWEG